LIRRPLIPAISRYPSSSSRAASTRRLGGPHAAEDRRDPDRLCGMSEVSGKLDATVSFKLVRQRDNDKGKPVARRRRKATGLKTRQPSCHNSRSLSAPFSFDVRKPSLLRTAGRSIKLAIRSSPLKYLGVGGLINDALVRLSPGISGLRSRSCKTE
jgi:hypothetical protein